MKEMTKLENYKNIVERKTHAYLWSVQAATNLTEQA